MLTFLTEGEMAILPILAMVMPFAISGTASSCDRCTTKHTIIIMDQWVELALLYLVFILCSGRI